MTLNGTLLVRKMRTRTKILIPAAVFLAVGFFTSSWLKTAISNMKGVVLTRFSEDEFQKHVRQVMLKI